MVAAGRLLLESKVHKQAVKLLQIPLCGVSKNILVQISVGRVGVGLLPCIHSTDTMEITKASEIDRYYEALVSRDPKFVGIYFVGVKTTGIFCISTCRARKPKRENVVFYDDMKDLLKHGYRPCKVCKPSEVADQPPADIVAALAMLKTSPIHKVSDSELRAAGIQPEKVRRWFNTRHGMTFQAYQRMVRINTAFQNLKAGTKISDTAYEAGYESLSGFAYTFKKITGASPSNSKSQQTILMDRITTPLGPMYVCATDQGICLLEFTDRRMLETEFEDLQRRLQAVILAGANKHTKQLKSELAEYFERSRTTFDVSLHTPSTPFRQQVWELLQDIPYGSTVSYKEQAVKLGNENAVRAVANANGHNRVAIVIPCHRVIGSDGSLTGYAGGLDRKRWLLRHEGADLQAEQLTIF